MTDLTLYNALHRRMNMAMTDKELLQVRIDAWHNGFSDLCTEIKLRLVFSFGYDLKADGTLVKHIPIK